MSQGTVKIRMPGNIKEKALNCNDVLTPCVVMSSELKKVECNKKLPHEILASNVDGDMDCKNTRHSR